MLAISAAVHVTAVGVADRVDWLPARAPRAPRCPVVIELDPPPPAPAEHPAEDVPTTVVLIDALLDPAVVPAPDPIVVAPAAVTAVVTTAVPSRARALEGHAGERPARGASAPSPGSTGDSGRARAPGATADNPWMDMRGGSPTRLSLGLPTPRWDGRAAPLDRFGPDVSSGKLSPGGGGTHRADEGTFTAKVDRDGHVDLRDKRNVQVHVPSARALGQAIAAWYLDDNKPVGLLGRPDPTKGAVIHGREVSEGDLAGLTGPSPPALITFDATDAMMRSVGIDPYAAKKLAFLDATRDERAQIGMRRRQEQLVGAAAQMQRNIDRAWASALDPVQRKQALFELWDECAETGSALEIEAGREARRLVIGAIRARLPRGSPDAYTADELTALDTRRTARNRFAPYDDE